MLRLVSPHFRFLALVLLAPWMRAGEASGYRTPSSALAAIVDAPLPPLPSLSPNGRWLLLLDRPEAPTIAELAQPELRLAGLRINPRTNGPSRLTYYTGLTLKPIDGSAAVRVAGLPGAVRIGDFEWSRDGRNLALTVVGDSGIELWLVDAATARARRLTAPILNAVFGEPMVWLNADTLVIRRTPSNRGSAPIASGASTGPIAQENLGRRAAARTFDGLLASPHDERLFEYYGASELALLSIDGTLKPLPVAGLITSATPSPDGRHVLVAELHRPFSYLVTWSRFASTIDVIDASGKREYLVTQRRLSEGSTKAVVAGPRSVTWRADMPATLSWVQSLSRGTLLPNRKTARDAWLTLPGPFTEKPTELQRFEYRVTSVQWGDEHFALVHESWTTTRLTRLWRVDPNEPGSDRTILLERNTEDRYGDPGRPATTRNEYGRLVVARTPDRGKIFLIGAGASPEGDRPFLDEFDLITKTKTRRWQSAPPSYEEFVAFADPKLERMVTARESREEPTNYFIRSLNDSALQPLTAFPNPYPQFAGVKQQLLRYRRADGVSLSGTLHLPPGWTPEKGPLPTVLWAYPREFQSAENAGQVKATPERFVRVSPTSPLPLLLAGYAVLNDPAMPIIAKKGQKSNDTYIEQLVANAQAAVDELVRVGVSDPKRLAVGGHSYGAFMTANLLAHTRLFRAGIARSGAYNRTLTPFGFQREQRTFWQAPAVYSAMSPFNFAHEVKDPLLLIHGEADNNSGTFPIQSERFYHALMGHGATTRLVLLPHEAHGYRARESVLHMLWEMETWLDRYVKNGGRDESGN